MQPKRYHRGAQERSEASRKSPKSLPKPPPKRSEGTLGRPKGLLGWFWGPQGLILEPPGSVLDCFLYFSRASLLSLFLSSFSLLSCISLMKLLFSLLSSLFSLLSSLFSLRVSLRSLQRRGGFREATGIRRAAARSSSAVTACQTRALSSPRAQALYSDSKSHYYWYAKIEEIATSRRRATLQHFLPNSVRCKVSSSGQKREHTDATGGSGRLLGNAVDPCFS